MPDLVRIQRRVIAVLSAGQVLGGLSFGATVSLGAVLAARLSRDDGLSGLAAAAVTLGTALAAIPLAALARRRGRRRALTTGLAVALCGVGVVVGSVARSWFPLLLVGFLLIGAAQAANLQSRFAATDLASSATRGRDLSVVVWATTLGAVLGPNLVGPGEVWGRLLGMPEFTGAYLFTVIGLVLGIVLYQVALRPDPLLLAAKLSAHPTVQGEPARPDQPRRARYAVSAIATAHLVMVAVMAMTPLHLLHHGATLTVVGLTISLHIAGMFAFSPLFGLLADRIGALPTILIGFAILATAVSLGGLGQGQPVLVTSSLVLLGLGWSGVTVAGSALLSEASDDHVRIARQGRSDFLMSLVGALGAMSAGGILAWIGFNGLNWVMLPVIGVVTLAGLVARAESETQLR